MNKTNLVEKCLTIFKKAELYKDFNIFTYKTPDLALKQAEQSCIRLKNNSNFLIILTIKKIFILFLK
jgi:hypothetical protein